VACIGDNTLVAFVDGALDPEGARAVDAHVAACPHCRALLSEIGRSSLVDGARAAAPAGEDDGGQLEAGTVLAERYRIRRFIARGGMGEVYEAQDLELAAPVALKMMLPDVAGDPRAIDRFKREIHLARRVTHPNVCRIFDVGFAASAHGGTRVPFLTMELLAGDTLSEWLHRVVRASRDEAQALAYQLASALQAAHDAGVVHRDFKSANIILVPTGPDGAVRAVVTDFGVARAVAGIDFAATVSGARGIVGSPGYMAPEQLQGLPANVAADIYAFGVVLYEMVTGHLPFEAATPMLTALRRLEHPPTDPRRFVPDLDPRWEAMLLRCLARAPEDRFDSAMAAFAALGSGGAAAQAPGEPPPKAQPWPRPVVPALADTVDARGAKPRRRLRAKLGALATAALLTGVVGVAELVGWWRHEAHAPASQSAPPVAGSSTPTAPPTTATTAATTATTAATTTAATAPATPTAQAAAAVALPLPPAATVIVRSEPAGAAIAVDGRPAGVTPATLSLVLPSELVLTLPGHRPVHRRVTTAGAVDVHLVARPQPAPGRLLDE
jgi:anti-sigma factor RsiW